ncbi:hypothetical protein GXW84_24515 [Rhodococcus sp. IEGM 248]|nr:hypothetical protein [Rhodococcus sp. IEGM 248]
MTADHPHPKGSSLKPTIDEQVREYRIKRRRKLVEARSREQKPNARNESDEIIRFATMWAPYGGAPDDETFILFGMSRSRFTQTLWATLRRVGCTPPTALGIATAYPEGDSHDSAQFSSRLQLTT